MRGEIMGARCSDCGEDLLGRIHLDGERAAVEAHAFHHRRRHNDAFEKLRDAIYDIGWTIENIRAQLMDLDMGMNKRSPHVEVIRG